jgi:oxygen-independent coproporphyrinogen III oxidase
MEKNTIKHLYIHIPFCQKKCPYCDFYSIATKDKNIKKEYLKALIKELNYYKNQVGFNLKTLYFGGGSPLTLGIDKLKILIKNLKITNKTEITIEINPEHLENTKNIIKSLKDIGFNRISIGVQTLKKSILKELKRFYNLEKLEQNIKEIKKLKINFSLDFMFGLPNQKIEDLKKDLNFVKKHKIKHVSFYLFTVSDRKPYKLPKEEIIQKMFKLIDKYLTKNKYVHYEVSNFAKYGFFSKHNLAYWSRKEYLGLGVGAHSFLNKKRFWKIKNLKEYIKNPKKVKAEKINKEKKDKEKIMLGLRLLEKGINKNLIKDLENLEYLKKYKLIKIIKNKVKINRQKTYLIDSIVEELI